MPTLRDEIARLERLRDGLREDLRDERAKGEAERKVHAMAVSVVHDAIGDLSTRFDGRTSREETLIDAVRRLAEYQRDALANAGRQQQRADTLQSIVDRLIPPVEKSSED
jgi:hypothetical protein